MNRTQNILAIILGLIIIVCPLIAPLAINTLLALMILAFAVYLTAIGVRHKKH
ncbi:MAG: hypothetical protein MJ209_04605 [archaeon]|nr:hypothetical protein [archaeon]